MQIVRSTAKDGGVFPSAFNCLAAVPDTLLHHAAWPSRHPLGIYSLSTAQVLDALERLIPLLLAEAAYFGQHRKVDRYPDLLRAQKDLLLALRGHVDDCYSILKVFVDPGRERPEGVHTEVFLKRVKMPGLRRLSSFLEGYVSDQLGPIVNSIKHHHGQLCPVILYDEADAGSVRFGYYLEEPWGGELVGPSWRVHRDGNSGFSFARDLRVHVYSLYEIAERLAATVKLVLRTWHGCEIQCGRYEMKQDRWGPIMQQLAATPFEPFPSEFNWPCATVETQSTDDGLMLLLEYPRKLHHKWQPKLPKVQITTSRDAGRGFKLPYMGKPKRPKRP